ncbi:MAG: [citrate (pro-3S)-lyase] ligase [Synergistetes bacterium]|nr:[citrate (pro-3S)-lyase] ligase [Synergistota bacterium]MDW8191591.1 [citrate (pro-3S)-lyase] ligase [Synergistota bacterium]
MIEGLTLKDIDLSFDKDRKRLIAFLEMHDLSLDEDVEGSIALFDGSEIVATCSLSGKVLKCFAVREDYRGRNLASVLVGEMIKRLSSKGIYKNFVFTKPDNLIIFESLGYKHIASGSKVILLEYGMDGIEDYVNRLKRYDRNTLNNGSIVMNCNPFTLGHRFLVEKASSLCETLYIFVVQEERSLFPFKIRKMLIEKGTGDLKNVIIIDGGDYVVSSATFPGYFIRKQSERIESEAELDIDLFSRYIAPTLSIKRRFVGSEPYDPVTYTYNRVMSKRLPERGIEFVEIPRLEVGGKAVSASLVRERIRKGDFEGLAELLPRTTLEFLMSEEAKGIIERIKKTLSPH